MSEEELLKQCKIFLEDVDLWFNFFHRGLFFKLFFSRQLGPHVIFAILAHTTLLHDGTTKTGQLRAISYAEEARKILDYYLSTTTPEPTLVQTALLLVAFEFQPHIHQNLARATAALGYVETCAKICLPCWMQTAELPTARHNPSTVPKDSSNATQPLSSSKITQSSTQAVRTEELRRMCWTLSQLAANSTIWRHLAEQPSLDLASADPTRFMLLFPLDITSSKADQQVPNKISSWVLYHKAVCLWHVALNEVLHGPRREHIVKQARAVISETDASEGKSGSRNYVWQARQWAVAARGHLGDLDRHEIVSWFETQKAVLEQFSGNDNQSRSRKPTFCWWYLMVAFTALRLSTEADEFASHTESVLSFVYEALESIVSMWPCSSLEHHYQALKRRHASVLRHREPGISNETRV